MVKTYDSIILECYEHINNWADFFAGDTPYRDDLIQETILVVLEMDRDRVTDRGDIKNLKGFVYFIMYNSINSSTSPFYKKIKKFNRTTNTAADQNHGDSAWKNVYNNQDNYLELISRHYELNSKHVLPVSKGYRDYHSMDRYNEVLKFLSNKGTPEEVSLFKCLVSEGSVVNVHKAVQETNPDVSYQAIAQRVRTMKNKIQDANL